MEYVEEQVASVVLVGNLNPAIFTPDWLARQGIISEEDAAAARIDVIHPELSEFDVPGLSFEIISGRFVLHAKVEPFVRLADIVADIFEERLKHTPLTAMGINYAAHFRVRDWRQQTALGRRLAPIEPWGDWGQLMEADTLEKAGGMASLTMQQSSPSDRPAGHIQVTVQPSKRLEPGFGVFLQVNDHYAAGPDKEVDYPQLCVDRIDTSLARSRTILSSMIDLARSL